MITVKEAKQKAFDRCNLQNCYETLEEAKEIACIFLESGYEYAEICEGYPGEWVQLLHLPEA